MSDKNTLDQIKKVLPILKETNTILSVFAGRIYDCGLDAFQIMKEICDEVKANSKCETLWASCRMAYDLITAEKSNADIITMTPSLAKKIETIIVGGVLESRI